MSVYYNENDPKTAQWLEGLIKAGLLPAGNVDDRSIEDVKPAELMEYQQCHFFAGIGGWAHALQLANWGNDPVWTGSCPCQPFSSAGRGKGFEDERHLWPVWFNLIKECQPPVVFGEQVASPAGRSWLDCVQLDLEELGFAFGAADLCAASVGAPHIRQRLWFVGQRLGNSGGSGCARREQEADQKSEMRQGKNGQVKHSKPVDNRIPHANGVKRRLSTVSGQEGAEVIRRSQNFWKSVEWRACQDGTQRPVEPSICPVADGVSARVVKLRGIGNAIVPQVAEQFVRAYREY